MQIMGTKVILLFFLSISISLFGGEQVFNVSLIPDGKVVVRDANGVVALDLGYLENKKYPKTKIATALVEVTARLTELDDDPCWLDGLQQGLVNIAALKNLQLTYGNGAVSFLSEWGTLDKLITSIVVRDVLASGFIDDETKDLTFVDPACPITDPFSSNSVKRLNFKVDIYMELDISSKGNFVGYQPMSIRNNYPLVDLKEIIADLLLLSVIRGKTRR